MKPDELRDIKDAIKEIVGQSHGVIHSDLRKDISEVKEALNKLQDDLTSRMDKIDTRLTRQEESQKKMEPTVTAISNLTWAGKIAVAFLIALGAIVGAIMTIESYIKSH